MAAKLHIAVLAGTIRVQRESIHAAQFVYELGEARDDITVEFVDPLDFNFPGDGNDPEGKDPRYTAVTERADGFFIVSPEYNHSFPGSLKRMLDSELHTYLHKPVALAGASSSHWGGVRAVEALVTTVREMGLVVTFSQVYFPAVASLFPDGKIDPAQAELYTKSVTAAYDELVWMGRALKAARDQQQE